MPNLLGIVKGLPKFYEHELFPVFVFDGTVLELKEEEMARRRERKKDAEAAAEQARAEGNIEEARKLRARSQRLTETILQTSRELLEILDVPIIDAPAEAEAQAAYLAQSDAVKYVATEDYDALLFGAPLTIRQITSSGDPELMELQATLTAHNLTRAQLVDIAILCGTDYNDGIHGIGPKTALRRIQNGESVEAILSESGTDIPALDRIREIYLSPDITDNYTVPSSIRPDFERAEQYLTDDWEIPASKVDRAFGRLRTSM